MTRAEALALDAADPLSRFVDEFVISDRDLLYLDGNSLGRLPRRTVRALDRFVTQEWGQRLVRGWEDWIDLPLQVGDRLGRAALGAAPGQVVVCDSTTVNLFKLIGAAINETARKAIVIDEGNFPTDRYVVEGLARQHQRDIRWITNVDAASVSAAIDNDVALVVFSHVDYRTATVNDVAGITAAVHAAGGLVLWDLSHAAGVVPAALDAWGVDLAVGCTYKYLNAGPGAPAWLYVARGLQEQLRPPVWGWFAQEDQFGMGSPFQPAAGMRRWLTGTPPVAGLVAVDAGVSLIEEAGIDAIRAKSVALTSFAAQLAGLPVTDRGGHLALHLADAERVCRELLGVGVVTDFRPPDILRLGFSPLSTRFVDVWDGFDRLAKVAATAAARAAAKV